MTTENHKESIRKWQKTARGIASRKRAYNVYRIQQRGRLFSILGGHKCVKCNFDDFRVLQFDHINGGGRIDMKRFGNTHVMVCYYLKHQKEAKEKLQVLCANCNWIKRCDNNEHKQNYAKKVQGDIFA